MLCQASHVRQVPLSSVTFLVLVDAFPFWKQFVCFVNNYLEYFLFYFEFFFSANPELSAFWVRPPHRCDKYLATAAKMT